MKKFSIIFATLFLALFASCSHSDIWEAIGNLEERVERLEEECQRLNTNIESLQTLVAALEACDTITAIVPIKQGEQIIGYTITFSHSEPITIFHGADGADGHTPTISVKQASDGLYYWTVDGQWLLDDNGERIRATGEDGEDGEDGSSGTTPQLKIEDDYWYISYDNGQSWTKLGKATGEDGTDGDGLFSAITWDEEFVYFTLTNGTVITLPLASSTPEVPDGGEGEGGEVEEPKEEDPTLCPANEIWYTSTDGKVVRPYYIDVFGAKIISNDYADGKGTIRFDGPIATIGECAFYYCGTLSSITLPEGVSRLGMWAFYYCASLKSIALPSTLTSLDEGAFYYCTSLEKLSIPEGVRTLGQYAFQNCSALSDISLPESLQSIGPYAFIDCHSLRSIALPESITTLSDWMFAFCTSLTSLPLHDKMTVIGESALYGCTALEEITLPESIVQVGYSAMSECTNLKRIYSLPTVPPRGAYYMFENNAEGRKIFVPSASLEAYSSAYGWEDYANDIVGF